MSWLQAGTIEQSQVKSVLGRVYARPEFAEDERTLFDDLIDWLVNTFDIDVDPGVAGGVLDGGMNLLLFGLAVGLAWLVVRFTVSYLRQRSSSRSEQLAQRLAIRARVRELYTGALAARGRGDFQLAVRLGLFALVTGLGVNGALKYRDAWTYREILRHGAPDDSVSDLLAELVDRLEAKEFGEAPITESDLDELESLCCTHLASLLEGEA